MNRTAAHRLILNLLLVPLAPAGGLAIAAPLASAPAPADPGRTIFTVPGLLATPTGAPIPYENGFMLVPENRNHPTSRRIAVRYLRFPTTGGRSTLAPIVMLPGGPGTLIDEGFLFSRPAYVEGIRRAIKTRDYIIIQQRGIKDGLYAASPSYDLAALPLDKPASPQADRARLRAGFSAALGRLAGGTIDLKGYTIGEVVEDVDDLRRTLGHDKVVLYGGSFGSQWGLAYIKTHSDRVARAVLTGLEPLDYGWDDPASLWAALGRIGAYAAEDSALAAALPQGGLDALYQQAILKLEQTPGVVEIADPKGGKASTVTVGADDLRGVRYPVQGDKRTNVEAWPKFLFEIVHGDYRHLATIALRRRHASSESLLGELIDGSIGISKTREQVLASHKDALRWLGDPNKNYQDTRDLLPAPPVSDAFLANFRIDIPLLVLQGDVDLSTPLENALDQTPYVKHGKVITVRRATHDIKEELGDTALTADQGVFYDRVMRFLTDDAATSDLDTLPNTITLAPFHFLPLDGPALYDRDRPGAQPAGH